VDRASRLRHDVQRLAGDIGDRNIYRYAALEQAAKFIRDSWTAMGYHPHIQEYTARDHVFRNLAIEVRGMRRPEEIVVVGAHYDTNRGSPGADDNASGVAALLELSRIYGSRRSDRTVRFVAFTNEERPFLRTRRMGSRVYARRCRENGEKIVAMVSLEMLGFVKTGWWSQKLSFFGLLMPRRGDFLAFVSNRRSKPLMERAAAAFRRHTDVTAHPMVLPSHFPGGWSSDHWCFWREGFDAFMTTDTARARNANYHTAKDLPATLDYDWMSRVVTGLDGVVAELAESPRKRK
jgi:Zn-dependent M28 family amino/carboxypeptidase